MEGYNNKTQYQYVNLQQNQTSSNISNNYKIGQMNFRNNLNNQGYVAPNSHRNFNYKNELNKAQASEENKEIGYSFSGSIFETQKSSSSTNSNMEAGYQFSNNIYGININNYKTMYQNNSTQQQTNSNKPSITNFQPNNDYKQFSNHENNTMMPQNYINFI